MKPDSNVPCRAVQALLTSLLGAGLMACGGGGGLVKRAGSRWEPDRDIGLHHPAW